MKNVAYLIVKVMTERVATNIQAKIHRHHSVKGKRNQHERHCTYRFTPEYNHLAKVSR